MLLEREKNLKPSLALESNLNAQISKEQELKQRAIEYIGHFNNQGESPINLEDIEDKAGFIDQVVNLLIKSRSFNTILDFVRIETVKEHITNNNLNQIVEVLIFSLSYSLLKQFINIDRFKERISNKAIDQGVQKVYNQDWIGSLERLFNIDFVREKVSDEIINQIAQKFFQNGWFSEFKSLLKIKGIGERIDKFQISSQSINDLAKKQIKSGLIMDFKELLNINGIGDRITDQTINKGALMLISRVWMHRKNNEYNNFKELLNIKGVADRITAQTIYQGTQELVSKEEYASLEKLINLVDLVKAADKEQMYRLIIGCYIKTIYQSDKDWKKLDNLVKEAELPELEKDYQQLKLRIEPLLERLDTLAQNLEKGNEIDEYLKSHEMHKTKVSVGADFEPMINVVNHEGAEKQLQVSTNSSLLYTYFRAIEGINTFLIRGVKQNKNFLEKGVYDSVHFVFGINKQEKNKLLALDSELKKLVSLISLVFNTKSRNYWIIKFLIGNNRLITYEYTGDRKNIKGDYDDLFEIRAFSFIAGLKNVDFLMSFIEYCRFIIRQGSKADLEQDAEMIKGLLNDIICEDLDYQEEIISDLWFLLSKEKLNPEKDPKRQPFVVSVKVRQMILDTIKGILDSRVKQEQLE